MGQPSCSSRGHACNPSRCSGAMSPQAGRMPSMAVTDPRDETVLMDAGMFIGALLQGDPRHARSEEHTSELQSQSNLVCRLLLEKKKNTLIRIKAVSALGRDQLARHLIIRFAGGQRIMNPLIESVPALAITVDLCMPNVELEYIA